MTLSIRFVAVRKQSHLLKKYFLSFRFMLLFALNFFLFFYFVFVSNICLYVLKENPCQNFCCFWSFCSLWVVRLFIYLVFFCFFVLLLPHQHQHGRHWHQCRYFHSHDVHVIFWILKHALVWWLVGMVQHAKGRKKPKKCVSTDITKSLQFLFFHNRQKWLMWSSCDVTWEWVGKNEPSIPIEKKIQFTFVC